jgi:hypothetical protein
MEGKKPQNLASLAIVIKYCVYIILVASFFFFFKKKKYCYMQS